MKSHLNALCRSLSYIFNLEEWRNKSFNKEKFLWKTVMISVYIRYSYTFKYPQKNCLFSIILLKLYLCPSLSREVKTQSPPIQWPSLSWVAQKFQGAYKVPKYWGQREDIWPCQLSMLESVAMPIVPPGPQSLAPAYHTQLFLVLIMKTPSGPATVHSFCGPVRCTEITNFSFHRV